MTPLDEFARHAVAWLLDQRSGVAVALALTVFAATLVLRYGYDIWWPWGIAAATMLAFVGLFAGSAK